ncbi:universal stress protein [Saccharibacillus sp. JS10]|uniref:universal stress protein n=1 Tax=Saccharibacillus sp. JS10 TaxID=2950552 RepID=UPI00210BF92F|nr:universal stress protein [Saccharibacillus sp. JS10]MCQ4088603.1 universal stress protein [Saccharibacillus sp. JS10]
MKHILVAVDGSESSQRALEEGIQLGNALREPAMLTALHIDRNMPMNEPALGFDPEAEIEAEGVALLDSVKKSLEHSGLNYKTVIRKGDPAREICEFAKAQSVDLIIVGTKGQSLAAELLLGSVSHKVIQHATCPVMSIR